MIYFSDSKKIELFDEITRQFYDHNFGQMSKSEIDEMMFHFYYDNLKNNASDEHGKICYLACSDYIISKELGISQQRVRNLKIKDKLRYPYDIETESAFADLIDHARYDEATKKVTVNIPDPNLFLEIQNFIETKGAYIETQLNPKILQIRAEYFVDLLLLSENEQSQKKIIDRMRKLFSNENKKNAIFDDRNIGKSLISGGIEVLNAVSTLSDLISPGNMIGKAFISLLNALSNRVEH